MMNDYRYHRGESKRFDIAKKYITLGPELPRDRRGLIMLWHPAIDHPDLHGNEEPWTAPMYDAAKRVAIRTEQHVFMVQDEQRWCMLVFGEPLVDPARRADFDLEDGVDFVWYDDKEENDQFVGSYDPDGKWKVHSIS